MQKKRNSFGHSRPRPEKNHHHLKRQQLLPGEAEKAVLVQLFRAGTPLNLADLYAALAKEDLRKKTVQTALDLLVHEGLVRKDSRRRFTLQPETHLGEGVFSQNPRGFGFVNLNAGGAPPVKDVFIPNTLIGEARHGDRVLVRTLREGADLRRDGMVIAVLSRGSDTITGIYSERGRLVYPDDPRFPFTMAVTAGLQPRDGEAVLVRYQGMSRAGGSLPGEVVEIIGPVDHIDTQLRLVVEKYRLPHQFSETVLSEAAALQPPAGPSERRVDLRQIAHITIDGESAEDFDDAIAVSKTGKGYRLYVSIADVSFYVTPGSAIDEEAYLRGTSVYFPGRVIPMLPERLANDLCSLVPEQDRPAVSAILDFDSKGRLGEHSFTRSLIRSRRRFTYTTVQEILIDRNPATRAANEPFLQQLQWAEELATLLQRRRRKRGAVDFNLPEAEFHLSPEGEVAGIVKSERKFAHQLIEECMLAANEAVASLFTRRGAPALYRIHQPPDPSKAEEFIRFVKTLGLAPPPFANTPAWFAAVVESSSDSKHQYLVNNLVLRSMQQAQYASHNVGHFGLAAPDYTHFTSPIRRYPDLMVHRTLLALVDSKDARHSRSEDGRDLVQAGDFLSAREREAVAAERDMHDRLKIIFMRHRVGDTFPATISGITDTAIFIELQDLCLSGSIAVAELSDDCYLLDQKNYRLLGEIHGKTYRIGDTLAVTLDEADAVRKRLHFLPAAAKGGKPLRKPRC